MSEYVNEEGEIRGASERKKLWGKKARAQKHSVKLSPNSRR